MPESWIFTFGSGHVHPETGVDLLGRFVRIPLADPDAARRLMAKHFGRKWGFQYESAEEAGVHEYGLRELRRDDWPAARQEEIS